MTTGDMSELGRGCKINVSRATFSRLQSMLQIVDQALALNGVDRTLRLAEEYFNPDWMLNGREKYITGLFYVINPQLFSFKGLDLLAQEERKDQLSLEDVLSLLESTRIYLDQPHHPLFTRLSEEDKNSLLSNLHRSHDLYEE